MPCHNLADTLLTASVTAHRCHLFVTGENFLALHAFYGDIYEALDGWYDRFAERALAEGERSKFNEFSVRAEIPDGDCIERVCLLLAKVKDAAENLYSKEDPTTKAMIDELVEYIDKVLWQLESMGE